MNFTTREKSQFFIREIYVGFLAHHRGQEINFHSDKQNLTCFLLEPNAKLDSYYLKVAWHPMSGYSTSSINSYLISILTSPCSSSPLATGREK
jgi:hypothetical protein